MLNTPIITLSTDFGSVDPLSSIMKGVILSLNPAVQIVDITHGIDAYNIQKAALMLGMSYKFFPHLTIHVAVTDPGVGSERRPIMVVTENYYFIGPDNGIFSVVYNESEHCTVIHLTADHYFLPHRSATFHGRDIFAPVAAWLAKGIKHTNFGEEITDYVKIPIPVPVLRGDSAIEGEVMCNDHFGNAITNIRQSDIERLGAGKQGRKIQVTFRNAEIPLSSFYSQASDKKLSAVVNSVDYLELFVYRGNASAELDIKAGEKVGVSLS